MWKTSPEFQEVLVSNSRRWATKVEIMYGEDVLFVGDQFVSGRIGLDNVAVRREFYGSFVDPDGILTPSSTRDTLSPKGTEARVWRGLFIPSLGDFEWVPLGVYGLVRSEVRSHSEGVIVSIKGFDRVDAVRARRFTDPWVVTSGTPITEAINNIVQSRFPCPSRITSSPFTTPEIAFDRLSSPWDAVRELAGSAGMVAYFDQLGTLVIAPAGGEQTGVEYNIGREDSVLINVSRDMDSSETFSGVIARGENPDKTVFYRAERWDLNPKSPTYADGPFGRRPFGYYSEMITDVSQLEVVAEDLFNRRVRMRQECEITTVGTVAHDVDDVFRVVDPRSKTNGDYRILSGTIPLRAEQGELVRWRCSTMAEGYEANA